MRTENRSIKQNKAVVDNRLHPAAIYVYLLVYIVQQNVV